MVHRNQLWKYAGENPPSWFPKSQSSNAPNNAEPGEQSPAESAHISEKNVQNSPKEIGLRRSTRQKKAVERFQAHECSILGQDTSRRGQCNG